MVQVSFADGRTLILPKADTSTALVKLQPAPSRTGGSVLKRTPAACRRAKQAAALESELLLSNCGR
jgi:hypothetical protein